MRDFDPCASEFIISGYLANSKPGRLLYDPVSILTAVAPSVIGGIMGGDSAGKAADAQAQSGRESDATQRYFYDTTRADNAPMRQTGLAANNRLAMLMGLNPGNAGVNGGQRLTREGLQNSLRGQYTNTTTTGTSGGYESNYTGGNEGDGYIQPQQIQTSTVNQQGLDGEVQRQLDQQDASDRAQSQDPAFGSLSRNFAASDLNADPVYQSGLQFGLDEGTKGINRQAAAGGSMLSGATLKALTRFGNDYGSTKANESFNRFNTNQTQQYNRLAGLSGAGQQATNQVSAAGMNAGNQIGSSQQGVGNARASGYLTQGNAMQNALNGGVSALKNSGSGGSPGWGSGGGWMGGGRTVPDFAGAEY